MTQPTVSKHWRNSPTTAFHNYITTQLSGLEMMWRWKEYLDGEKSCRCFSLFLFLSGFETAATRTQIRQRILLVLMLGIDSVVFLDCKQYQLSQDQYFQRTICSLRPYMSSKRNTSALFGMMLDFNPSPDTMNLQHSCKTSELPYYSLITNTPSKR